MLPIDPISPRSKKDLTKIARERVVEQAFRRAIEEVEKSAKREEYLNSKVSTDLLLVQY